MHTLKPPDDPSADDAPAIDARDFRNTVGLFATGVAIMAARLDDEVHAMTVNSFTSVSLHPPLILVCVDCNARMNAWLQKIDAFAISFLGDDQEAVARRFAHQVGGEHVPEPLFWGEGAPLVVGALGGLRCTVRQQLEGGDHVIVLGHVSSVWEDERGRLPLLYFRGSYHVDGV